jgi:segregation and condensation protein A
MDESIGAGSVSTAAELLHVRLPVFDGPLDLLLHLVRKHQLDIQQLRLAELTEPYLLHLERMKELNLDVAGEFLAIASTLVWIKSKSLLPRDAVEDKPDASEMEALLIERLREYQRIKDAAVRLTGLDLLGRDLFPRQAPAMSSAETELPPRIEIGPVTLFDLIEAFRGVLERAQEPAPLDIVPARESIEDKVEHLLRRFEARATVAFADLFDGAAGRAEIVLVFLALLELVRLKAVRITQSRAGGEILCATTEAFIRPGAEWKTAVMAALLGGRAQPTAEPVHASESGTH